MDKVGQARERPRRRAFSFAATCKRHGNPLPEGEGWEVGVAKSVEIVRTLPCPPSRGEAQRRPMTEALVIFAARCSAASVSGLAGFGTALTAIGIWLHVAPPPSSRR